jgi:hypothetical protein
MDRFNSKGMDQFSSKGMDQIKTTLTVHSVCPYKNNLVRSVPQSLPPLRTCQFNFEMITMHQ